MRKRWKVDEDAMFAVLFACLFIWVPLALLGNWLTGGDSHHVHWGFTVGLLLPIAPWVIGVAAWLAVGLVQSIPQWRLPIHRVTEPVTTDLREAHRV